MNIEIHHSLADLQAELDRWMDLLPEAVLPQVLDALDQADLRREAGVTVYPPREDTFRALRLTQPQDVKCVILGQDPYHGPGQANGLSFSVSEGCKFPPSLRNIFQELASDLECEIPVSGDLTPWAQQGVLLLNSILTVEEGRPASHAHLGWNILTEAVLHALLTLEQPIVFLLWGRYAQQSVAAAKQGLDLARKKLLPSAHPSPLSARRGFFGSRPFSQVNAYLVSEGVPPIRWELP